MTKSKRDSILESIADNAPVPRDPRDRTVVNIPIGSLRIGDKISLKTNSRTGKAMATELVRSITIGRGCQNVHVNSSQCFDRITTVDISVDAS